MLLTLKPPIQNGIKGPHEYSILRQSLPTPHTSSTATATGSSPSTPPAQPVRQSPEKAMDQNPRRGLPPPAAMTTPAPDAPVNATAPMSQLPPPPHWYTPDDAMRHWLQTKAEEDRRKQEEERTRQEGLRLEQRRIENNMLREAVQAGVPPHMVPLIFAALSGGNAARSSWDMAQQVEMSTQATHQRGLSQHQQQPPPLTSSVPAPSAELAQSLLPPDFRRDSRAIPPNPYATPISLPPASARSQPMPPSPTRSQRYSITSQSNSVPSGDLRGPVSSLSRLDSGETRENPSSQATAAQYQPNPSAPSPASMPAKSEATQSSIYFHHWVPPGQSQPNTPSTKGQHETVPRSQHRSESLPSPPNRKRKAQGPHQPPPVPASQSGQSPIMAHVSSPRHSTPRRGHGHGHSRGQSDVSYEVRYRGYSEPEQQRRQSDRGPDVDRSNSAPRKGYGESETGPAPRHIEMEENQPRSISIGQYDPRSTTQEGGYAPYHPRHDQK